MEKVTKILQVKRMVCFIFIFLWMALVFYLSSQNGDESKGTSSYFVNIIIKLYNSFFNRNINVNNIGFLTFIIRKLAHFTLYFIGAIPIYLFLSTYSISTSNRNKYTIIACFIYACTDELHQFFIPFRDAKIFDILVDICGSVLFLFIKNLIEYLVKCKKVVKMW